MRWLFLTSLLSLNLLMASPSTQGSDAFVDDPSILGNYTEILPYFRDGWATNMIRGQTKRFCFWFNPNVWQIEDWIKDRGERITFRSSRPNLYATIIVENARIPKNEIRDLVLDNIKKSFNQVKLHLHEIRRVNGSNAYCFQCSGYYNGDEENLDKFRQYNFYMYMVPTKVGLIQLITFCREDTFDENRIAMLSFLNGISLRCR